MKTTVIVDSDVIVEYLKTGKGILPTIYEKFNMIVAPSTFTELLASKTFTDETLKQEVVDFLDKYFTVQPIDKTIAVEASKLVRDYELTLGTAYVGAMALRTGAKLVTNDRRSFERIPGIDFLE